MDRGDTEAAEGNGVTAFPIEHGDRSGESIALLHGGNVANWMWQPQVERLPGRHLITPDLPGHGSRAAEPWPSVAGTADDVAGLIAERAVGGTAHIVGLSLGGLVAVHLAARHPGLVRSCLVSSAGLCGVSGPARVVAGVQLRFWDQRWFWRLQARAFGIPADSRRLFVDTGMAIRAESATAIAREVNAGTLPAAVPYDGPVLAVAGERDLKAVQRAVEPLGALLPQLQTWTAPGMHHVWSIEDPALFATMVAHFVDVGCWPPS